MNTHFHSLFSKPPKEISNGDYYYNTDSEGDQFNEIDAKRWLEEGVFQSKWKAAMQANSDLFKCFYSDVCDAFSKKQSPFIEIACGPGMGLAPLILSKDPSIHCLVTDACSLLIKSWRKYIDRNLAEYNINLASFSIMDIPIKSNSVDVVTSFIGISSTRVGEQGQTKALNEVYRILKEDGYFIAIENEWIDYSAIEKTFELWGRPIWIGLKKGMSWQDKFTKCGFIVEADDKAFYRKLLKDDNELGEQADKFGIEIMQKFTLFVLRKSATWHNIWNN